MHVWDHLWGVMTYWALNFRMKLEVFDWQILCTNPSMSWMRVWHLLLNLCLGQDRSGVASISLGTGFPPKKNVCQNRVLHPSTTEVFCMATENSPTIFFDELLFIVRTKIPGLSLSPRELPTDQPEPQHGQGTWEVLISNLVSGNHFMLGRGSHNMEIRGLLNPYWNLFLCSILEYYGKHGKTASKPSQVGFIKWGMLLFGIFWDDVC